MLNLSEFGADLCRAVALVWIVGAVGIAGANQLRALLRERRVAARRPYGRLVETPPGPL